MSDGRETTTPASVTARFIIEREDDGYTLYMEMEPLLAFARTFMDADVFHRFELGVRRAADEMRDRNAPSRRLWWKPRRVDRWLPVKETGSDD